MTETASCKNHGQKTSTQNMDDFANCNLYKFLLETPDVSQRSPKKLRFSEGLKKKIRERLRRKRQSTREVSPLPDTANQKAEAVLQENSRNLKVSHLANIIERLWEVHALTSTKTHDKNNCVGHPPCYLQRNINTKDREKRSTILQLTSKKRKRGICYNPWKKREKTTTESGSDFYFRFRNVTHINPDSKSTNSKAKKYTKMSSINGSSLNISTEMENADTDPLNSVLENGTFGRHSRSFETLYPREQNMPPEKIKYVPLFTNPRSWKSVVKENDD